ncbi:MAG TPA: CheR family methyltransferase, partial [Sedimentisphaerales bacterium]|nr:CheR family methyltransferase [Sedimentisphaerales bacterium]
QHFQYLATDFLPHLLAKKTAGGRVRIRGWSAGCSSGEEPYSLAITLLENLPSGQNIDMLILATDLAPSKLEIAQRGVYDAARTQPIAADVKHKYFLKRGKGQSQQYEVGKTLRDIVRFGYLNLMEPWPVKGPIDFIFCRNVMIYFDKPTQENLVNRFWDILGSGGVLFTGHSESLTGIKHKFNYVQPTIYRKS